MNHGKAGEDAMKINGCMWSSVKLLSTGIIYQWQIGTENTTQLA